MVTKDELPVRVGIKETAAPVPACYCLGIDVAALVAEVERGAVTIPAAIAREVRAGRCACEVKNPSGRCCLAEVNRIVKLARGRKQHIG
jgi:hypothetical protein